MNPITVLLAEDHQLVREGIRALLKLEPDIEVIGEAADGREAVKLYRKLLPAVVLMDIGMPSLNGLEATRQIRSFSSSARILILSAYSDDAYVDQAIEVCADGFVLKQTSASILATAIREVYHGRSYYSPAVSLRVSERSRKAFENASTTRQIPLTRREREILQLIAEGKPNKQVANELGVSFKTVDKHRQHLMSKLDIHDLANLTRYAISEGIIETPRWKPEQATES